MRKLFFTILVAASPAFLGCTSTYTPTPAPELDDREEQGVAAQVVGTAPITVQGVDGGTAAPVANAVLGACTATSATSLTTGLGATGTRFCGVPWASNGTAGQAWFMCFDTNANPPNGTTNAIWVSGAVSSNTAMTPAQNLAVGLDGIVLTSGNVWCNWSTTVNGGYTTTTSGNGVTILTR